MKTYLGIDIAKASFDVHLVSQAQRWSGQFANEPTGFDQLLAWLGQRGIGLKQLHCCLEATGSYGVALATYLQQQGCAVSILNPRIMHNYAKSKMRRNKTDKLDARLLADYCQKEAPPLWQPAEEAVQLLRAFTRRLTTLQADRSREVNRLKAAQHPPLVEASIQKTIAFFDTEIEQLSQQIDDHIDQYPDSLGQQRTLLTSIPGIGNKTAVILLGELPDINLFRNGKQVTAFAGLTPEQLQSGSTQRNGGLVKLGSSRLRTALYFPAIVGMRFNPILANFAQRLAKAGKSKMTIIGALMRKLLLLVYGVLKSQQPFDPDFAVKVQVTT